MTNIRPAVSWTSSNASGTPREQAAQDKLEAKRAEYRRKYQRRKELKAQREAKAAQDDNQDTTETA